MTVESLAKVNTVNALIKTVGLWALIGAVLWAVSEIRDTKAQVIASRLDQAVIAEKMVAITQRVEKLEGRLDKHEEGKR